MTALIIIGVILLIIVMILFLPVHVTAAVKDEAKVFLRILFVRIKLFPMKEKPKKKKSQSRKSQRKKRRKKKRKKEIFLLLCVPLRIFWAFFSGNFQSM